MKSYEVIIDGVNLDRLINQLAKQMPLKCVCRNNAKQCSLVVSAIDKQKVVDYLHQKCYNNYIVKPIGYRAILTWFRRNIALSLIALIFLISLLICSRLCLRIDVDWAGDAHTVVQVVNDYGIVKGSFMGNVQIDELENYLCNHLNCAYAVVEIDGSVLRVKIIDKALPTPPIDFDSPHDVLARYDAVVTRVALLSGTSVISIGDTVSAGQTLIVGLRTFKDGTTQPTYAIGQIYGKVTLSLTERFTPSQVAYRRTGKCQVSNSLILLGNTWQGNNQPDYAFFESQTDYYYITPLNIQVVSTTIYELEQYTYTVTIDEVLEDIVDSLMSQLVEQADFEIECFTYTVDGDIITVTASAEILISTD
ncbi:MAG: sporulation protein YqfD [Clostridia bacterium]|nr:sporulation protein YqfD [Clostridia bacterium]